MPKLSRQEKLQAKKQLEAAAAESRTTHGHRADAPEGHPESLSVSAEQMPEASSRRPAEPSASSFPLPSNTSFQPAAQTLLVESPSHQRNATSTPNAQGSTSKHGLKDRAEGQATELYEGRGKEQGKHHGKDQDKDQGKNQGKNQGKDRGKDQGKDRAKDIAESSTQGPANSTVKDSGEDQAKDPGKGSANNPAKEDSRRVRAPESNTRLDWGGDAYKNGDAVCVL